MTKILLNLGLNNFVFWAYEEEDIAYNPTFYRGKILLLIDNTQYNEFNWFVAGFI